MKEYSFTMQYLDTREISFIADSLEEAKQKTDSGDWLPEDEITLNFEAYELIEALHEVSK